MGHWLDEHEGEGFTVIEVHDGLTVVVGHAPQPAQEIRFLWDDLVERASQLQAGRRKIWQSDKKRKSDKQRNADAQQETSTKYQDVLRAIGFELDDAKAHGILVAQVGDEFALTYSYVDAAQGLSWRKHRVVIDRPSLEEIRRVALARRGRAPQHRGRRH